MILVPIFVALARELGFGRESRRAAPASSLRSSFGTILPVFAILPANLPNVILLGVAETPYGVSPSYAAYLLLHFPVLGLLYTALLAELICRLFPDRPSVGKRAAEALPPWSAAERRLLGIMVVPLLLWATDSQHGVAPGWVALAAAVSAAPLAGSIAVETTGLPLLSVLMTQHHRLLERCCFPISRRPSVMVAIQLANVGFGSGHQAEPAARRPGVPAADPRSPTSGWRFLGYLS